MYKLFIKRLIDLILSLVAIIILFPLMIILFLLIKLKLGSPAIFKQERPGLNEEIFTLYKFKTMTNAKNSEGDLLPDELRLTKFGKLIRSTSLDELPELFNVLKGDMSLVGPRPLLVRYLPFYREKERKRSQVKPGITGLAQVCGRNVLSWNERFSIDVKYVEELSLWMDLQIIIKTISLVLKRKDILVGDEHVLKDLDEDRRGEFVEEYAYTENE